MKRNGRVDCKRGGGKESNSLCVYKVLNLNSEWGGASNLGIPKAIQGDQKKITRNVRKWISCPHFRFRTSPRQAPIDEWNDRLVQNCSTK